MRQFSLWVVLGLLAIGGFATASPSSSDIVTDKENVVECYKCTGDRASCLKNLQTCTGKACRRSHIIDTNTYRLECLEEVDEGIVPGKEIITDLGIEVYTCLTDRCNEAPSSAALRLPSLCLIALSVLLPLYFTV